MTTLCLTMIVKNESAIIKRCIDSVRPIITSWCIVDTGSTDGTQEIIKDLLKDLPGSLYERPWKNFEHNKTEAINLAIGMADYDLFLDADDVLVIPPKYKLPKLTQDQYVLMVDWNGCKELRPHIFKNNAGFVYKGVRHEYLWKDPPVTEGYIKEIAYKCLSGGIRARTPDVYKEDALAIEEALKSDPSNPRYLFYAGTSWLLCNEFEKAIFNFEKALKHDKYDQQRFLSMLRLAVCYSKTNRPYREVFTAFIKAAEYMPSRRVEVFHQLCVYLRSKKLYELAYEYARGSVGQTPPYGLNVNSNVYDWMIYDELAINAYYIGNFEEAEDVFMQLLEHGGIFETEVERIQHNAERCQEAMETGKTYDDVK